MVTMILLGLRGGSRNFLESDATAQRDVKHALASQFAWYICGTAPRASAFFRRFTMVGRCGHMYGLLARFLTAGLDEVRDASG